GGVGSGDDYHHQEADAGGGDEEVAEGKVGLGRVFVIGGAEVYRHALSMPSCERILWTRVRREFECDTFFPDGVLETGGEQEGGTDGGEQLKGRWMRKSNEELQRWVGEEGVGDVKREGDVEFEVIMMEKER
ncbi:MAG: hypothetical protein Q9217_001338, partial [Psora testacea]